MISKIHISYNVVSGVSNSFVGKDPSIRFHYQSGKSLKPRDYPYFPEKIAHNYCFPNKTRLFMLKPGLKLAETILRFAIQIVPYYSVKRLIFIREAVLN